MGEFLFQGFLGLWELCFTLVNDRLKRQPTWIKLAAIPFLMVLALGLAAALFVSIYVVIGLIWALIT
jgi:hypothetical protein